MALHLDHDQKGRVDLAQDVKQDANLAGRFGLFVQHGVDALCEILVRLLDFSVASVPRRGPLGDNANLGEQPQVIIPVVPLNLGDNTDAGVCVFQDKLAFQLQDVRTLLFIKSILVVIEGLVEGSEKDAQCCQSLLPVNNLKSWRECIICCDYANNGAEESG